MDRSTPTTLNSKHRVVAYLEASGKKPFEIAKIVGYHPHRLVQIRSSPAYKLLLQEMQTEVKTATFDHFLAKIDDERVNTLDTLIDLRDNGTKDDSVRLGATRSLLEYDPVLMARLKEEEDANDSVRVMFPKGSLAMLVQAMGEVDGKPPIDVSPRVPLTLLAPVCVQPKSIDDLLEEMEFASEEDGA